MRSTLDELITEMAELRELVSSIEPVNNALAGSKDSLVQRYVSIRRRFDYAAFAVALYAFFEKFVENLIMGYARLESRRVQYAALPQKLTSKHLAGTVELLGRGRLGEGRYVAVSPLDMVRNLFECLSGTTPYTLNEAAVIAHDSNLRANEVDAVFAAVGIEKICAQACRADEMVAWYCATQSLDAPPQDGVRRTVIEERIKDIVERRNQVAHRGNAVELLGVREMREAIDFIESFSKSLFGLVVGRYLENHHSASAGSLELVLRRNDGPYKNRTVVIVEKPAQQLHVGQPVFVILESTGARWGRIQSLTVDGEKVRAIDPSTAAPNGVGVGLDFRYPKNTDVQLVALASEDDVVWSPPSVAAAPAP